MKRMTITVDDTLADWVRMEAARRHINVSHVLGDLVSKAMRPEKGYEFAMHEALQFKTWGVSDGHMRGRDEIYTRGGG